MGSLGWWVPGQCWQHLMSLLCISGEPSGCAKCPVTLVPLLQVLREVGLISPCAEPGSLLIILLPFRKKGGKKPPYFFLQNCYLTLFAPSLHLAAPAAALLEHKDPLEGAVPKPCHPMD